MSESTSPTHHKGDHSPMHQISPRLSGSFLLPSPIPTKRTRTQSMSERARSSPVYQGTVKSFCREKGHGFIKPVSGDEDLFFHISDIDGEFVPKEGDEVTYKRLLIPPKNEKFSAVHVTITHMQPGVTHPRWEEPVDRNVPQHSTSPH